MTDDTKLTLNHRLELEATIQQVKREEAARLVRLQARHEIAGEVIKAQAAITAAEEAVLRNLPTPPPEAVKELVDAHPVVVGRRHQLERFERVFGPARLDQAENLAKVIAGETTDPSLTPTQKPGRRPRQAGSESEEARMFCIIFSLSVLLMALAGLLLMVGWKSGASKLARIAIALVIGSAILSWLIDVLRSAFTQRGVQLAAGGLLLLFFAALAVFGVGWFLKEKGDDNEKVRPTIRRRAELRGGEEEAPALPPPQPSSSTDDLNLFGGSP